MLTDGEPMTRLLALPAIAIVALALLAATAEKPPNAGGQARPVQQVETPAAAVGQAQRDYVLEIIGLGVTLDKYRQGKLWEALQQGDPYASIREQDKENATFLGPTRCPGKRSPRLTGSKTTWYA
jgi:hypothetical protein